MIATTTKKCAIHLTIAATIVIAPLARAQDVARTQVAAAIGAEEEPVTKPPAPTNKQTTPAPQTPAEAPESGAGDPGRPDQVAAVLVVGFELRAPPVQAVEWAAVARPRISANSLFV